MTVGPFLHEVPGWPALRCDLGPLGPLLARVHFKRGRLGGEMRGVAWQERTAVLAQVVTSDVVSSSRIEGERLPRSEVYASVAWRLGLDEGTLPPSIPRVDGVVDMTLDTARREAEALTDARLFRWHHLLFPVGLSGGVHIEVGAWRTDRHGPMQVVSAHHDPQRRRVHFEALEAQRVPAEMEALLTWVNSEQNLDPVVKVALAHLHFLTVHPFEDGNGRIARAISDLLLTHADGLAERYFSLSTAIEERRAGYYEMLSRTQAQRGLDVTPWVQWFLEAVEAALDDAQRGADVVAVKFEVMRSARNLSGRQRSFLERVFAGWDGHLTSQKYARMHGVSTDTALRDLSDLCAGGVLSRTGDGRGARYRVRVPERGRPLAEQWPEQFVMSTD